MNNGMHNCCTFGRYDGGMNPLHIPQPERTCG